MKKIKHIILLALTALALGLPSLGGAAAPLAGGRGGMGGDIPRPGGGLASIRSGGGGNF